MADAPKQQPPKQETKETEVERLARLQAAGKKCSGFFKVGVAKHYRLGRMYEAGEIINIEDEVPSKTWTPYDPNAPVARELPAPLPKAAALSPGDIAI